MQEKSTPSLRLKTTARQPSQAADGCRTAPRAVAPARDWRARIVAAVVEAQPRAAVLGRVCRSAPRYRKRSWWLDTSTTAQSRRAVKRWHGGAQDLWNRNVEIPAWVALGAAQAHVGAKYGLTRQRVGQIVREFPWVRQAVRDRLRSLDENNGREGGKCQSSLRGKGGSFSSSWERGGEPVSTSWTSGRDPSERGQPYSSQSAWSVLISSREILWTLLGLKVCRVPERRATSILPPVRTKN